MFKSPKEPHCFVNPYKLKATLENLTYMHWLPLQVVGYNCLTPVRQESIIISTLESLEWPESPILICVVSRVPHRAAIHPDY